MNRFEYRILQTDISQLGQKDVENRLNAMGSEGWSVVAAIPHERHGYSHEVHFVLSRCMDRKEQSLTEAAQ